MKEGVLYDWPAAAKFGRPVPKTKFYEHAHIATKLRQRFVTEVERIVWAYKLADETINLRGTSTVPEIQVFQVAAKADDVSDDILIAIDKSIKYPLLFEVSSGREPRQARLTASYKQLNTAAPKLSPYFTTGWLPAGTRRQPLPPAIDLEGLYHGLISPIVPVPQRHGESVEETIIRIEQTRRLQREVDVLERKMKTELQLNRKIELHRQLRAKHAKLTTLTDARLDD